MNLREYVEAARYFSKKEMEACARHGDCNQCGLCCVSFADTLPIEIPAPGETVELFRKNLFEVCPHLRSNGRGETQCGAHDQKGHPSLRHCADWRGPNLNEHPLSGLITDFGMLVENFWVWAIHLSKGDELFIANEMIKKGLIHHIKLQAFDLQSAVRLVTVSLEQTELPHELFGLVQFRRILELSGPEVIEKIKELCGLNKAELNPKKKQLVERYLS